ncbi:MAG: type II secretion system protein [Candidatus Wildermuthbacteria bacterium]|nr:type II secretion system protein [Candidatus Wildermuthbacteria bacterium]
MRRNEGFTLIELLVVIGIIGILSALIVPNFRAGDKQFVLQRSASKLAQDLRRAEELSMSAKPYPCPSDRKMKGYGINIDIIAGNNYYSLKARCEKIDNPGDYSDENAEALIYLEKGAQISSPALQSIFFYPPNPVVDLGALSQVQIVLSLQNDPAQTKVITVNKAGLINVQ